MTSQERLAAEPEDGQPAPRNVLDWIRGTLRILKPGAAADAAPQGGGRRARCGSAAPAAPRGEPRSEEKVRVCCNEELETSFSYVDENVNLRLASPPPHGANHRRHLDSLPELSRVSEDEPSVAEGRGSAAADCGFAAAVACLVAGVALVVVSYAARRDGRGVAGGDEGVAAREMERMEARGARLAAHLDRCVIAGLCLLTLGGAVLSCLLMATLWRAHAYRRRARALSTRSLYGSFSLQARATPPGATPTQATPPGATPTQATPPGDISTRATPPEEEEEPEAVA